MIEVAYLADHLEVVPQLAQWFLKQWPEYFREKSLDEIESDFYAEANRINIPIRLIALIRGNLAGTIVLRERAFNPLPKYTPGLGGLYVSEPYRQRGIGTELVRTGMKVAKEQGYENIFAGASTAQRIFETLGWEPIASVREGPEQVVLYRYSFEEVNKSA
jgi:GNAT superfamily N-acetyltransferase